MTETTTGETQAQSPTAEDINNVAGERGPLADPRGLSADQGRELHELEMERRHLINKTSRHILNVRIMAGVLSALAFAAAGADAALNILAHAEPTSFLVAGTALLVLSITGKAPRVELGSDKKGL